MTQDNRSVSPNFNWPIDEDGKPMALVTMQLSELIGLPNYSNITVGPGSVTKFVSEDRIAQGLEEAAESVEEILSKERDKVLDFVESKS